MERHVVIREQELLPHLCRRGPRDPPQLPRQAREKPRARPQRGKFFFWLLISNVQRTKIKTFLVWISSFVIFWLDAVPYLLDSWGELMCYGYCPSNYTVLCLRSFVQTQRIGNIVHFYTVRRLGVLIKIVTCCGHLPSYRYPFFTYIKYRTGTRPVSHRPKVLFRVSYSRVNLSRFINNVLKESTNDIHIMLKC